MVNFPHRMRTRKMGFQKSPPRISRTYWPHGYGHHGELAGETVGSPFSHPGSQVMVDSKHPWPPKKGALKLLGLAAVRNFDSGGDLLTTKTYYDSIGHTNIQLETPESGFAGRRTYSGPWIPVSLWTLTPLLPIVDAQLIVHGTRGIKLGLPTAPQSGVTKAIGELKDIPKAPILDLYKALRNGANPRNLIRNGGSEYLNVEFGWRPLLKDMQDLHTAIRDSSKTVDQLVRDSGKTVRRTRTLVDTVTSSSEVFGSNAIGIGPTSNVLKPIAKPSRTVHRRDKVWTRAAYMYYLHPGKNYFSAAKRNEQVMSKLFGTRFNISTFWELSPWSWVLDWVANIGDVLANLAAFTSDNLILKYAYVMFEAEERIQVKLVARTYTGEDVSTTALSVRYVKRRLKATPYGFGFSMANLTAKQYGILAALGASRV